MRFIYFKLFLWNTKIKMLKSIKNFYGQAFFVITLAIVSKNYNHIFHMKNRVESNASRKKMTIEKIERTKLQQCMQWWLITSSEMHLLNEFCFTSAVLCFLKVHPNYVPLQILWHQRFDGWDIFKVDTFVVAKKEDYLLLSFFLKK